MSTWLELELFSVKLYFPLVAYVSNPVPNSSLCRAAAPRLCPLQLLLPAQLHRSASTVVSTAAPRLHSLQLLLAACVSFSCCSLLASASAAALDCIHFNCSPIASASAAAPQLSASTAAPRLRLLQLLLPDCVRFNCCSPPAVLEDSSPCPMFLNILHRVRGSVN